MTRKQSVFRYVYHVSPAMAQDELETILSPPAAREVLGELRRMDEERVAGALREAAVDPEGDITGETISALFETLSYHTLLDDAEVGELLSPSFLFDDESPSGRTPMEGFRKTEAVAGCLMLLLS